MSVEPTTQGIGELEFLMRRNQQLIQVINHSNEIIHTTFYISIVVFGIILGAIPQLANPLSRASLYVFAAAIFLAMYLWTRTYVNTRSEVEDQLHRVAESISELDVERFEVGHPSTYFSDPVDYRKDRWEDFKERFLVYYYLGLAGISVAIMVLDLAITEFGVPGL